jgi:uncharacterized protein YxeA
MKTKYSYPILLLSSFIISLFLIEYNLFIYFIFINLLLICFIIKNIFYDVFNYYIKEEKIEYESLINDGDDIDDYSQYCKICSACGEEGCCSPLNCSQHKDGEYCEWYLRDLKYAYKSNKEILKYIEENYDENSEINIKINEILNNNINKFY